MLLTMLYFRWLEAENDWLVGSMRHSSSYERRSLWHPFRVPGIWVCLRGFEIVSQVALSPPQHVH